MKAPFLNVKGLILLRKASGLTSFESLNTIKKALSTGKVGHTGTLDKFASGLLLVLIGQALKLSPFFTFCEKEYLAEIRFGIETDTLDLEGEVAAEAEIPSRESVEAVLPGFRGNITQAPPEYSAVHINGKRAHELSRQGIRPEMKKRPVIIHELELVSWDPPFALIRVSCSAGTYIRSLARDIALAVGSRAHLSALERTRIGGFHLSQSFEPKKNSENIIEEIMEAIRPINIKIFDALNLPYVFAEGDQSRKISHGQSLNDLIDKGLLKDLGRAGTDPKYIAVFGRGNEKEELIAVLEKKQAQWSYGHVFADH